MSKSNEKEILINRMYNGEYAKSGANIGHEIINLFTTDDEKHYIYVLDNGTIAQEHYGKVEVVLLTRLVDIHTLEILAKATDLKLIVPEDQSSKNQCADNRIKQIHDFQEPLVENIKYGGVSIKTILEKNSFNGKYEGDSAIWVTFSSENISKPKKLLYLSNNGTTPENSSEKNVITIKSNLVGRNQRRYIGNSSDDYELIKKALDDPSIWSQDPIQIVAPDEFTSQNSFMKIIRKEYDELSYSNMLSYFFAQDHRRFCRFAAEVLGISDFDDAFQISREENNIDILIKSEKYIIVIENKIKSGINGIQDSGEDMQINSQLSKYHKYGEGIKEQRKAKYFIFTPDYQRVDLTRYSDGIEYTRIPYSKILAFFDKEEHKDDEYYEEFLKALRIHASESNTELSDEMLRRFIEAIKQAKS